MSRLGVCLRIAVLASAVALTAVGCTSSSTDGPTSALTSPAGTASVIDPSVSASAVAEGTAPVSQTASVIDVPIPSSTLLNPEAQEAVDRAAVEAQWVKFWDIYINFVRTPESERDLLAATVSIEPIRGDLLKSAANFESEGRDNYGTVTHRLSWIDSISGGDSAVISDCQDQSQFGSVSVSTGETLSVGVDRDNIKGAFEKGSDGIWRLKQMYYITEVPC